MATSSPDTPRGSVARKFPRELLTSPFSERLAYFGNKDLIIEHPALTDCLKSVKAAIDPGLGQNFVLLLGPTGVGKTVLQKLMVRRTLEDAFKSNQSDRVSIPAIFVEALAPDESNFAFRELYVDALSALHVPLIEQTLPEIVRSADGKSIVTPQPEVPLRIPTPRSLRRRLRKSLLDRSTVLLALDEAAHVFTIRKYKDEVERKRLLEGQGNTLKSLVNGLGTTLLCAGSYELYELALVSEQLARRGQIVPLFEYSTTPKGIAGYTDGLLGLLSHLPVEHDLDATDIASDMFFQSAARIGTSRTLLYRFLQRVGIGESPNKATLARCFFPKKTVAKFHQTAADGRRLIETYLAQDVPEGWQLKEPDPGAAPTHNDASEARPRLRPGETTPDRRWTEDAPSVPL